MSDDLVRLRELFGAGGPPAPDDADCPPSSRIYDAANGELPPEETARVVDHVAACHACTESWRLAVELEHRESTAEVIPLFPHGPPATRRPKPSAEAEAEDPPLARVPRTGREAAVLRPGSTGIVWLLAVVGVLVLAALASLPAWFQDSPQSGSPLELSKPAGEPGPWTTPETEREVSTARPLELVWAGGPAGATYDAVLTDAALYPLARQTDLTEPRWLVPARALADQPRGARLLWRVEAVAPTGERSNSPTWSLVLR